MTWLLVGGDSEIGRETAGRARQAGVAVRPTTRRLAEAAPDRPFLDLNDSLDGWQPPADTDAACIFAAIARIAACENDPAGSERVNVTQTLALTDRLLAAGAYVLFLSTNQVFDGTQPQVPPDTPANPQTEYGRQKAQTEAGLRARMAAGSPVAILRLAKVVSPDMKLVRDWIAALKRGEAVTAFTDMMLAPTPTALVAEAIIALMKDRASGIFQLTGPADLSYAEMARRVARALGAPQELVREASGTTIGLPKGALPANTTLDSRALWQRYRLAAPPVDAIVTAFMAMEDK